MRKVTDNDDIRRPERLSIRRNNRGRKTKRRRRVGRMIDEIERKSRNRPTIEIDSEGRKRVIRQMAGVNRCFAPEKPIVIQVEKGAIDKKVRRRISKNVIRAIQLAEKNESVGINTAKKYSFTKREIFDYFRNDSLLEILNTRSYVYHKNKLVFATAECFDVVDNQLVLKDETANNLNYCASYSIINGKKKYAHAMYAKGNGGEIYSDVVTEYRKVLDDIFLGDGTGGGRGIGHIETYADALCRIMSESPVVEKAADLSRITSIDEKTISDYRNGNTIPRVCNAMIINVGLRLDYQTALYMIGLTGVKLLPTNKLGKAYCMVYEALFEMDVPDKIEFLRYVRYNFGDLSLKKIKK